ncbi:MAG: molybdopterin-containing oxidoreductase family protein [bacterium]
MEIRYSVCPHDCPDTCALKVEIGGGGKIIKVAGDPSHPVTGGVICEKVRAYPERIYNPLRILYPMRRAGEKGSGRFERISWKDAVDTIVKRWKDIALKYGPESILPYSYGGTEGVINHGSMDRRLFNRLGAARLERTICSVAGTFGYRLAYGSSIGTNPADSVSSKFIILWGINALETNMHQAIFADNARKKGAKIIAIDVHKNKTAKWADDFYLILPGSDGALALGLAHVILRDGLADKIFLEKYSYGFAEFYAKAKEFPPERVADLTGIAQKRIEDLAHSYAAAKPSFIRIGNGLQHHNNGGINTWAVSLLPALVGAWKDKGGGALKSNSGYFPLNDKALERPDLIKNTPENFPRTVNMVQLGKALCELNPPIYSLYVYNSNPAVVAPNQNLVLKGLGRDDLFTVVHEQVMTDTAKMADIILPATTSFEHADLYKSYWHTSLQWADAVIPALGEAKPNIDVFKILAERLGFKEPCFLDSEETIAEQALDLPYWREQGVTLSRLKKERFIMLNVPGRPFSVGSSFTPSHKIEFKSEKAAELGLLSVPDYKPIKEERMFCEDKGGIAENTVECVKMPAESYFSLTLITPPNHFFLNSTFADIPSLKIKPPEPFLEINPKDAEERKIKDGDLVKVENRLGMIIIKAKVIDSVLPGVVVSTGLWWRENYINGCGLNTLTNDRLSDIGGGATFFSTSVEVEKIT